MGNQQPRLVLNMKKIILNGKESNYTITEEGRVFNLTTNKVQRLSRKGVHHK